MPVARVKKDDQSGLSVSSDETSPTKDGQGTIGENGKIKRKRQSQSCDACRARKVRCARENADDPSTSCKHCIALGIPCTYDYQPKKRGPPNLYLRRLQEAQAASAAAQKDGTPKIPDLNGMQLPKATGSPNSATLVSTPTSSTNGFLEQSLGPLTPLPSTPLPPSRYPIAADNYHGPFGQMQAAHSFMDTMHGRPSTAGSMDSHASAMSPSESFSSYPFYNMNGIGYRGQSNMPQPNSIPPLSYFYRPHRLDDVAPRETIMLIISLFFDFVYPLTPCIHKPSFMADLQSRREERDPLFFALVMSTVASTLVQVPRSYLPMDRPSVRKLAETCHEASRHVSVASYDPPTSTHVVLRYLDTVYHFCEGHDATSHASFGEAAHIAVTLHMHEEASYEGLDPIESEIRRRTFWLLFDADKSMSILLGRPICLRDEDCTVHFPKEVDDEFITPNGILPQPHGKTAIISGLNYISRIFALLGEIVVRIRVDKRSPPQGPFATARLEEVRSLHSRIMAALSHAPHPLRLKSARFQQPGQPVPVEYGGANFRQTTFAEVKDFFDNPNASRANASNPFYVMQANLYVTQQLVRFVIEQYRDELIKSMRGTPVDPHEPDTSEQDREAVASDLLNVLHSIPIQSIATNGPSLVHKVRFVASTLLDAVRKADTAPASAARAHAYLWDFLSILSEIERNYLLDDDKDGGSSGDGMPIISANGS